MIHVFRQMLTDGISLAFRAPPSLQTALYSLRTAEAKVTLSTEGVEGAVAHLCQLPGGNHRPGGPSWASSLCSHLWFSDGELLTSCDPHSAAGTEAWPAVSCPPHTAPAPGLRPGILFPLGSPAPLPAPCESVQTFPQVPGVPSLP